MRDLFGPPHGKATRRALIAAGGTIGVILAADRIRSRGDTDSVHAWQAGVPMPHAHSETPAVTIDGKIYLAGGFEAENRLDRFDPVSQMWEQLADLPVFIHHPGAAALNGLMYVAGGYQSDGHTAIDTCWVFDPALNRWDAIAPLPSPKGAFGLVAIEGALYAAGGALHHLGGAASAELLRYDPATDRWEGLAPMPTGREHLAVVAYGEAIFAIGGRANGDDNPPFSNANERYDLASDTWSSVAPLPVPRGGLASVAVSTGAVVLGGERGSALFNDANHYLPDADRWDALPRMPTPRHGLGGVWVDGELFAIAGSTLPGRVRNTGVVEILPEQALATPTP